MNRPRVRRLVTVFGAITTVGVLGVVVACGGGERPDSETDTPITRFDAGGVTSGGVTIDVDDKGVLFGDNGLVNCGAQSPDKVVTLKNTTSDIVNFTAKLSVGDNFFTIAPAVGAIPAGATSTIVIAAKPIPAESDVSPDLYAGTLEVKVANQQPVSVRLHQTARGAIIKSSVQGNALALAAVKVGESSTSPFSLTNSGNAEATASLTVASDYFTIDGSSQGSQKIGGSETKSSTIKFSPKIPGDLSDTLTISYNSSAVFCGEPPRSLALTGKGSTSVGISASTLDFGLVNCAATAAPQTVTVSGTVAMTFTAVLQKGGLSPYTLANDADGSVVNASDNIDVPAASSFKLRVVPKPIPSVSATADNGFGDTLTITTNVTADQPHVIQLRETAKGAILSFDLPSVAVTGPVGSTINTNYNLRNTGNLTVPYKITTDPTSTFSSTITTGTAIVGSTAGVLQSKAPTTSGATTAGTMKVELGAGGGILCADLPPSVPLTVQGTGTAITINPGNLNFGLVKCAAVAPPAQFFTLASTVANNIKLSLGKGPASQFFFAKDQAGTQPIANNTNVAVGPGNSQTVWVVPIKIPTPSNTTANFYGDVVTLTSDIVGEAQRTIPLTLGVSGSIISFPGSVKVNQAFTITNQGNSNGDIDISGPANPTGSFGLTAGATVAVTPLAEGTITISNSNTDVCGNLGSVLVTK